MGKKYIFKFIILVVGIFFLSGCSFNPFGLPNKKILEVSAPWDNQGPETAIIPLAEKPVSNPIIIPPTADLADDTPVIASSSVSQPAAAVPLFNQVIREYQKGVDYELNIPANYFVADPAVTEISCDFAKACPCVYDDNYPDVKDFCARIASSSRAVVDKQNFCVQQWSEGAAGSVYTTYIYTMDMPGSYGHCVALRFTTRLVNDCQVYDGNDENIKRCQAEKAAAPGVIKNVLSSFKIIPPQLIQ